MSKSKQPIPNKNPMKEIIVQNLEYEKTLLPSISESILCHPVNFENYQKAKYLFKLLEDIDEDEDIKVWVLSLYTLFRMYSKNSIIYHPYLYDFQALLSYISNEIEDKRENKESIDQNLTVKDKSLSLILSDRGIEFDKWSVASSIRRLQSNNHQFNHLKPLQDLLDLKNPLLAKFNDNIDTFEMIEIPKPSPLLMGELGFLDYNLPIYDIAWDDSISTFEEPIPDEAIFTGWLKCYEKTVNDRQIEVFLAEMYKPASMNRLVPWLVKNLIDHEQLVNFCKYNLLLSVEYYQCAVEHEFGQHILKLLMDSPLEMPLLDLVGQFVIQDILIPEKFMREFISKCIAHCQFSNLDNAEQGEQVSLISKFFIAILESSWMDRVFGSLSEMESFATPFAQLPGVTKLFELISAHLHPQTPLKSNNHQ